MIVDDKKLLAFLGPQMRDYGGYSFRFIKQRLESERALSAMDGLYMLERAVEG